MIVINEGNRGEIYNKGSVAISLFSETVNEDSPTHIRIMRIGDNVLALRANTSIDIYVYFYANGASSTFRAFQHHRQTQPARVECAECVLTPLCQ